MSSGLLQNGSKSGNYGQRQSQSPESVAPSVRVRRTLAQDAGEPGRGDRESATESQSPSEAGRRIKEPGG